MLQQSDNGYRVKLFDQKFPDGPLRASLPISVGQPGSSRTAFSNFSLRNPLHF